MTENYIGASAVADFTYGFLTLLFLTVAQLPFIQFTFSDREGSEHPLKDTYMMFLNRGFSVYLFGLLYCLLVSFGLAAFIVPGLIILVLLFLTPYITVVKDLPAWQSWRLSLRLGKKYFFRILALVVAIGATELLLENAAMFGMTYITTNYPAVLLSQMLLNVFLFPLVIIIITTCVLDWKSRSWL